MNPRIQQLADEAAKYSAIMALPTGQSGNELFVEKFAELIVRECTTVLERRLQGDMSEDMDVVYCILDIEKHFGVKL